jgi:hypothetical protein
MKKLLLTLLALSGVLLAIWIGANWRHFSAFPSILPAFYAKEFCSCRYVMKRSVEDCRNFARQWIKEDDFQLDETNRRVSVTGMGRTESARFTEERYGCVLE